MKFFKIIFLFFCLGLKNLGLGQENLIPNGDFEEYSDCPTSISTPGDYQIEKCIGWYAPTLATPDYFNACASWPASVPNNIISYLYPQSGNAYMGVFNDYCFETEQNLCNDGFWIEYIQTELSEPLTKDSLYEFSCFIAFTNNIGYQIAFSEFGALFTNDALLRTDTKPFDETPQVLNKKGNIILDTDWKFFSGEFIAKGGEKFITMGFFMDTLNLDTITRPDNEYEVANWRYGGYYFIDNCSLTKKELKPNYPNIFSPNNDGINDEWSPSYLKEDEEIQIFNRWGNLVYILNHENKMWNGTHINGTECSDGLYFFISNQNKQGNIHLIR